MQLELQLKQRGKELTVMEIELSTQNAEISDLVFALEASNTENKYLHDEISRYVWPLHGRGSPPYRAWPRPHRPPPPSCEPPGLRGEASRTSTRTC